MNLPYSATEWENVKKMRITKCNSYRRNWICLNATMIEFLPWWNHMKSCSLFLQRSFKINSKKLPGRLSFDFINILFQSTPLPGLNRKYLASEDVNMESWSTTVLWCVLSFYSIFIFFICDLFNFFHFLKYLIGGKAFTKVWTRTLCV